MNMHAASGAAVEGSRQAGADPLLHCLALTSHLLGLPVHVSALRAGFAVDDQGHVPAASMPDMARQHGLLAARSEEHTSELQSH